MFNILAVSESIPGRATLFPENAKEVLNIAMYLTQIPTRLDDKAREVAQTLLKLVAAGRASLGDTPFHSGRFSSHADSLTNV